MDISINDTWKELLPFFSQFSLSVFRMDTTWSPGRFKSQGKAPLGRGWDGHTKIEDLLRSNSDKWQGLNDLATSDIKNSNKEMAHFACKQALRQNSGSLGRLCWLMNWNTFFNEFIYCRPQTDSLSYYSWRISHMDRWLERYRFRNTNNCWHLKRFINIMLLKSNWLRSEGVRRS